MPPRKSCHGNEVGARGEAPRTLRYTASPLLRMRITVGHGRSAPTKALRSLIEPRGEAPAKSPSKAEAASARVEHWRHEGEILKRPEARRRGNGAKEGAAGPLAVTSGMKVECGAVRWRVLCCAPWALARPLGLYNSTGWPQMSTAQCSRYGHMRVGRFTALQCLKMRGVAQNVPDRVAGAASRGTGQRPSPAFYGLLGRWQVAVGRWQSAGGRWQSARGRWQSARGRWQ